jgi:hypothetical protein
VDQTVYLVIDRVCSGNLQTELRQNAQILPQSLRPLLRMIVELPSRRGVKSSLPRFVEADSIIFWKITA